MEDNGDYVIISHSEFSKNVVSIFSYHQQEARVHQDNQQDPESEKIIYKGYEIVPALRQDPDRDKWMPGVFVVVQHAHLSQQIPFVAEAGVEFDSEEEARDHSITMGKEAIDAGLL